MCEPRSSMSVKASRLLLLCNLYTSFIKIFMGEGGIDDFQGRESKEYLTPNVTLDYWVLSSAILRSVTSGVSVSFDCGSFWILALPPFFFLLFFCISDGCSSSTNDSDCSLKRIQFDVLLRRVLQWISIMQCHFLIKAVISVCSNKKQGRNSTVD